jgi:6-phosphogluconolactonase
VSRNKVDLLVVETAEQAAEEAGARLATVAGAGGHIALAGGSTPRRAYELAAERRPDWSQAEVWWSDERCVPPDDERSNYRMAREALLDQLVVPPRAAHRIRGELEPDEAAAELDREYAGRELDLVVLGLGPDGHTASLFPGSPALDERERWAVAAPPGLEPLVPRVTMTLPALARSRVIIFLAEGREKAEAAARAFVGDPDPATPASLVRSAQGETLAILDAAAASRLRQPGSGA